mmetsp:Transcript_58608/g.116231  ORF Transcript_58608/g.116231 Transcript_58608/m.116231 type:complete len:270 (+) Transcript_58608:1182-1991(+)
MHLMPLATKSERSGGYLSEVRMVRDLVRPCAMPEIPIVWESSSSVISVFAAVHLKRPWTVISAAAAAAADAAGATKNLLYPDVESANPPSACHPRKLRHLPLRWLFHLFQAPVPQTWSVPASAQKSASRMGVVEPAVQHAEKARCQNTQTPSRSVGGAAAAAAAAEAADSASVVMLLAVMGGLSWCCTLHTPLTYAGCAVGLVTPSFARNCSLMESGFVAHKSHADSGSSLMGCSQVVVVVVGCGWHLRGFYVMILEELQLDRRTHPAC